MSGQKPSVHARASARGVVDVLDPDNPTWTDSAEVNEEANKSEDELYTAFFYGNAANPNSSYDRFQTD